MREDAEFPDHGWDKIRCHVLEFQPAKRVSLVGEPPTRIRVVSFGDRPDVAPGLLARVEELAGTPLRIEFLD